ncbi:hypothetical protein SLH49_16110 [Cognatiyoonia sp. IB215446]|uniref:hypothetical protein n=1 Tax=Cognatiyoonia sp. IB215446 TaxID=3097355 RepID=UPI002A0E275D|nr:hypothetical protein [Cognatiyoonia sp. IB215446]MDX8349508.1 hypothetical protein [Cognatiyoonia sp. IB215446]
MTFRGRHLYLALNAICFAINAAVLLLFCALLLTTADRGRDVISTLQEGFALFLKFGLIFYFPSFFYVATFPLFLRWLTNDSFTCIGYSLGGVFATIWAVVMTSIFYLAGS